MPAASTILAEPRAALQRAERHVAALIDENRIGPGEALPSAADLARAIDVSRPVVLDAMVAPAFDILDWPRDRRKKSDRQHHELLEAIAARDADAAAAIAFEHVRVSADLIRRQWSAMQRRRGG